MVRNLVPVLILLLAIFFASTLIIGNESYVKVSEMKEGLNDQQTRNDGLHDYVGSLKVEVWNLQHDDRELEKAGRNQQGLARENELVYIFDKHSR